MPVQGFIFSKVSNTQPSTLPKNKPFMDFFFFLKDFVNMGGSPSEGGWIARPSIMQHKKRRLTKYQDLTEN